MNRWITVSTATVLLLATGTATGQQKEKGTNRQAAEAYLDLGRKFFAKRMFEQAIDAFKKAYKLWSHKSLLYNIALAYAFKGDNPSSAQYLSLYLKEATADEKKLPEVLAKVQRQTGLLIVTTELPDASIFVDGREAGKHKIELFTTPGPKVVDIRLKNVVLAQKNVTVPAGSKAAWHYRKTEKPVVRPPVLPPRKDEKKPVGTSSKKLHWAYFAAAAALTGAAVITAFGLAAKTKSTYDEFVDTGRTSKDLRNEGLRYQNAQIGMWVVGGVAAAASVVLVFFTRWSKKEKEAGSMSIQPTLSPHGLGVTFLFTR